MTGRTARTVANDPRFVAALALADAWAPALDRSFRLGHAVGYERGRRAEQDEQERWWSAVAERVRAGASTPQRAKLEQIRNGDDHSPCNADCGACSRCTHAASWTERGGRPYLGAEREAKLARRGAA